MTISSNLSTVTRNGNGVATSFSFPFKVWDTSQLDVYITDPDGATTQTSNFTATLSGSGGNVVYPAVGGVILPTGWAIVINRNMPFTQSVDLVNGQAFYPDVIEQALDELTATCQQLDEGLSRSVKVDPGQTDPAALLTQIQTAITDSGNSATAASAQATAAANSANTAALSAAAAAQSAAQAEGASSGLAPRMDAAEQINAQQDNRLDAVESGVAAISTTLIGSVQSLLCADSYVPNGCVPANGGEYTRAQFPALYDTYLAGGKLLTCTYTAWAAQVAITGNCAKFALDTVNQKFKVPLLKDGDSITQASSAAELGKSVKAGLPNISGEWARGNDVGPMLPATAVTSGAFKLGVGRYSAVWGSEPGTGAAVGFDASRSSPIYGNSTTVTDEQVRLRHFVVLASAQNNTSAFDWSNYMAGLAGKVNTDLSNVDLSKANIVLQQVRYQTGEFYSITNPIPFDDTIPQNTEGAQIMSLAFTPKSATSKLLIEAVVNTYCAAARQATVAVFKDSVANALAASTSLIVAGYGGPQTAKAVIDSVDTSPHIFTVRCGGNDTSAINVNGYGARRFGGMLFSSMVITEYAV